MRLFKNVDICDLGNILEKGLQSMDECGNDNWDDGRRGNNSTSVVYLFRPKGEINSFPYSYGVALVECDCDAQIHEMSERDVHRDDHVEYVFSRNMFGWNSARFI